MKCGAYCQDKKVRGWIDQVEKEGLGTNLKVVLVKPDREKPYVILPFDSFAKLLEKALPFT